MNFATLAEVKSMFDPPITDTVYDAALEIYMAAVGAEFDNYCNRAFEAAEYTEILNGGVENIWLRNTPVDYIIGVWVDADQQFEDDDALSEENEDFTLADPEAGRVYGPFLNCLDYQVKVQYFGGYAPPEDPDDEPEIPADLKLAFIRQVVHDFKRRKDVGLQNITFKDGSISKTTTSMLLPVVTEVLDRYRTMNV
jgi:hypothetical protein